MQVKGVLDFEYVDCRLVFPHNITLDPTLRFTKQILRDLDIEPPWTPSLYDRNMVDKSDIFDDSFQVWEIRPDGSVSFRQPFNYRISCHMKYNNLPYDNHNCQMKLESFLYLAPELLLEVRDVALVNGGSFRKPEPLHSNTWKLGERVWTAEVTTRDSENFVDGGWLSHGVAIFEFSVDRIPFTYENDVVVPTILFWWISYMGFFISAESVPARAAIHAFPVLIIANTLHSVANSLPQISYNTWLGDYTLTILISVVAHLFTFAIQDFCKKRVCGDTCIHAKHKAKSDGSSPRSSVLENPPTSSGADWHAADSIARHDPDFMQIMGLPQKKSLPKMVLPTPSQEEQSIRGSSECSEGDLYTAIGGYTKNCPPGAFGCLKHNLYRVMANADQYARYAFVSWFAFFTMVFMVYASFMDPNDTNYTG